VALTSQALSIYPSADPTQSSASFADRPHSWPRQLGWVPNFAQWRPGDILVFDGVGGLIGNAIQTYQKAKAHNGAKPFANFTHCGVYLGEGLIADARFKRLIGVRRLWPETMKRALCVLRFDPQHITSDEVRDFLEEVYSLEDIPYGTAPAAIKSWLSGTFLSKAIPSGLVCSALIEYAASRAGIPLSLARKVSGPMLPASFMAHPWLLPVQAEWFLAR